MLLEWITYLLLIENHYVMSLSKQQPNVSIVTLLTVFFPSVQTFTISIYFLSAFSCNIGQHIPPPISKLFCLI